jgi:hypothetical protein
MIDRRASAVFTVITFNAHFWEFYLFQDGVTTLHRFIIDPTMAQFNNHTVEKHETHRGYC